MKYFNPRLKMIHWMHVFMHGLPIMTPFAQGLPVTPIPEELLVTTVRDDVIHVRCLHVLPFLHALHTQRVLIKVLLPGFPPSSTIATAGSGPYLLRVQSFVSLTILLSRRNQRCAARMLAWNIRFCWHQRINPHSANFSKPPILSMYSRAVSTISA